MSKNAKRARAPRILADLTQAPAPLAPIADNMSLVPVERPKAIRAFTKSGNKPWRRKFYHLDAAKFDAVMADKSIGHLAPQAQLTLRWMRDKGVTVADNALDGPTLQARAISDLYVRTRIAPANLFAYYRKQMEEYGLVFTGYNIAE